MVFCRPKLWICLPPVAAKVKTPFTGTPSLQQHSFVTRVSAVRINKFDAFESFRTSHIFVWTWHFQLQLCRHNLSYAFVSYEPDYCGTVYPEIHIWKLITSVFLPHWRRIYCKVCIKDSKHSLRSLLFSWDFFFCIPLSKGIGNQEEHAISF